MNRITSLITVIALSALVVGDAQAQWNVARFETDRNRVYTTFGLDPAFINTVGYGRVVSVFDHDFQLTGDAGLVTASMDKNDFRARLSTQTSLLRSGSVNLVGSATFITRGTENSIYRGFNFGADLTGALGVYRPRWFAAGEFGFDKAIITHVTLSDWYRRNFYPDAKNGWYLDAGGTYHTGVAAGITVRRTELVGRFGWLRTEDFNQMQPPFYGTIGLGLSY